MTTMTVTDALAELTLLEKRINSARVALDNNTLIAVVADMVQWLACEASNLLIRVRVPLFALSQCGCDVVASI